MYPTSAASTAKPSSRWTSASGGRPSEFFLYYTAVIAGVGAIFCRTSANLIDWSESQVVSRGGAGGSGPADAECACGYLRAVFTVRVTHRRVPSIRVCADMVLNSMTLASFIARSRPRYDLRIT